MLFDLMRRAGKPWPVIATAVFASMTCQAMAQTQTGALEPDQPPHLASHGGTLAGTAFPRWFADRNGVAVELCGAKNDTLNACVFDPPIAGDTYSETLGFGDEAFWWLADTSMPFAGGTAQLVLGVEAAFGGGPPLAGDEFTFGRVRMRIDVPAAGTYKVTYPFGEEIFTVDAPGTKAINATLDTGTFAPDFDGPQKSRIGAFLVWPSGAPVGYVGDGATPHIVTGSPSGFNKFRVEKTDGGTVAPAETDQFVVSGRLFTGQIETLLESRRATYDGYRLEVLATSTKDATVTASWNGATPVPLYSGGNGYFYLSTPVTGMPSSVVIAATAPNKTKAEITSKVVDIVNITGASYNPATKALTVSAKSSMYVQGSTSNPVLKIEPFGVVVPADLSAEVPNIPVPPAHVKVASSLGGSEMKIVTITGASPPVTGVGATEPPPPAAAPVPNPDNATAIINTPVVVNVLANDTDASGINPTSIVITTQPDPLKGSIGLIDLAGIQVKPATGYVSNATANPPDAIIFSYAVKDTTGAQSAPATVTVKVIGESLNVTQAEFRTGGGGWRIRGTSDALASNTITASLNGTTIGSAAVDPTGAFDIRAPGPTPTATSVITLTSSKGTALKNIGITIRK
jgi:hypothetical protein